MYLLKNREAKVTIYVLPDILLLCSKKEFLFPLPKYRTMKLDSLLTVPHPTKW